jgi:serine/threonine protein kinase
MSESSLDTIDNSENSSDNSSSSSDNSDSSSDNSDSSSDNSTDKSLTNETDDDIIDQPNNLRMEGQILNHYNFISELGRGSFSIVWLAYNIENNRYYAIKIQNPDEYKDGIKENNFMKTLPHLDIFNNLVESFIEIRDNKKYLCSVYELSCSNLDCIVRKGKYQDGLPFELVRHIMLQILEGCNYLHKKLKVYHGDIKTDNILLRGISKKNESLIELYNKMEFNKIYSQAKKEYGNKKISKDKKIKIRSKIHAEICNKINTILEEHEINKYEIDDKYILKGKVCLADFGSFVEDGEYYDESYGTRYYRSPENILIGKSSFPTDIWSLGCTFYELLTGRILFNPEKDKHYSRDDYHLKLINESCGPFPITFINSTKLGRKHFNSNGSIRMIKDLGYTNKIENKLKSILSDKEFNLSIKLIKGMLKIKPSERITASDAIKILMDY